MKARKVLFYDIMMGGRFVCTMRHHYLPCFPLDLEKILSEIFEKRPSLQSKRFDIVSDEFSCTVEPTRPNVNG